MINRTWRVGSHVVVRGRHWRIANVTPGDDCEALRLIGSGAADSADALTVLVPFDRPIPQDVSRTPRVFRLRRWLHELDRLVADVHPYGALASTARAAIRLLPYQLEPALAVVRHGTTRVLIADAVGLGKTIQAGVMLAELHTTDDAFRGIVLAPAGLRDQWASELRVHFGLTSIVADAAWLQRTIAERPLHMNPWSLPGIYISSHDFVKRPEALRPLEDVSWDLVIVDEAHHAATGTDRRAAIDAVASRSLRVVLLTATPPSESAELDALCRIGRTADSDARPLVFARARSDVDNSAARRTTVLTVTPSPAETRMHALLNRYSAEVWKEAAARKDEGARLASIVLRKRALSSAGSLATSVERRIALLVSPDAEQMMLPLDDEDPLDDEARADILAVPGLADCRRERRWLGAIAEAARTASRAETKMLYLLRLLRRIHEPVIIFTEYRDTLDFLVRRLGGLGFAEQIAGHHGDVRFRKPLDESCLPVVVSNEVQVGEVQDAKRGRGPHR
jgi:superfamily II DNA or RNA helicase